MYIIMRWMKKSSSHVSCCVDRQSVFNELVDAIKGCCCVQGHRVIMTSELPGVGSIECPVFVTLLEVLQHVEALIPVPLAA